MAFSADTLRDIIEAQWNLTGEISKNTSDNMKERNFSLIHKSQATK